MGAPFVSAAGPSVVVADDHVPMRRLLRAELVARGFDVRGEAGSAAVAVAAVREHRPQLCTLDLQMPGGGLAALREIAMAMPSTACVVVTAQPEDEVVLAAVRAGALGVLPKTMSMDGIAAALRGVLRGEAALTRAGMGRVIRDLAQRVAG